MSIADAERDEISESGRVVSVVEEDTVIVAGRLEHQSYVNREEGVTN